MNFISHYSSSSGNLYTVEEDGKKLLLECGVPVKKIREALKHGLSDYEACLLSHSHLDHAQSAKDIMKAGIDLFCSPETATALGNPFHRLNIVYPMSRFKAGGFQVLAFPVEHDCPGSLGFLILSRNGDKLLFSTDTFYLKYKFEGLTHIAVECNYSKDTLSPDLDPVVLRRLLTSHFNLEHVKDFLAANDLSKVREVHLLHLSAGNSNADYFKREVQKVAGKPVYVAGEMG